MRSVNVNPTYPADKEVRVRRGTVVRVQPRITGETTRRVWSENTWWPVIGSAGGGYKLIGWNLAEDTSNIGYVHRDDILEWRDVPPPVQTDADVEAYKLANKALQDEVANVFEAMRLEQVEVVRLETALETIYAAAKETLGHT